mmetsp:Transcript_9557/g.21329  ORF Transcript_9557/g.21329 Transcript_9557/m.21329 type:complete len:692 (-) Transcript_9557:112-2187(-)|eukprot:CAMPEP_0170579106 /NCGR_PEP_ID=MMETSP0224-20130122/5812_1 /TAXON_ID=285029 /ORGANISM="Togula jolla, Strain CCCM 725" /LENGTH=691 /DNA_ID=CAMNT_0010902119 /DNA_START=90 /DNA_END=2165 /DNA_ORIENTATION=-
MSSDVHLTPSRYYGSEDNQMEWWEEKWEDNLYGGYGMDMPMSGVGLGYYDGWEQGIGAWEYIEVDIYSMVFKLDATLEPQDIYNGFDFEEKSLMFVLKAEDLDEQSPAAWRSRPLRIHPEPLQRLLSGGSRLSGASSIPPSEVDSGICTPTATSAAGNSPGLHAAKEPESVSPIMRPKEDSALSPTMCDAEVRGDDGPQSPVPTRAATSPVTPGSVQSQSPKIVISNTQLEHLKQKMLALKQKRSLAPTESANEEAGDATPRNSSGVQEAISNCPGAHGLRLFRTPESGWWCSVCEREHPEGASFYGCRSCDYDECENCALMPISKRARATKGSAASASEARSPASPRSASPDGNRGQSGDPSAQREASPEMASSPSAPQREKKEKQKREGEKGRRRVRRDEKRHEDVSKASQKKTRKHRRRKVTSSVTAATTKRALSDGDGEEREQEDEEDEASSEEARPRSPARDHHRNSTRDPRLVPREKRAAPPDRWDPRKRKLLQGVREAGAKRWPDRVAPPGGTVAVAALRPGRVERGRASSSQAGSQSSSEEPLSRGGSLGSGVVSLRRASSTSHRSPDDLQGASASGNDEGPRTATRRVVEAAVRPRGQGDDLLRRVLRANSVQGPRRSAGGAAVSAERPVSKELLVETAGSPFSKNAGQLAGRDGPHGAPPRNIRKALQDFASQGDRKSRRV